MDDVHIGEEVIKTHVRDGLDEVSSSNEAFLLTFVINLHVCLTPQLISDLQATPMNDEFCRTSLVDNFNSTDWDGLSLVDSVLSHALLLICVRTGVGRDITSRIISFKNSPSLAI
jgi:hypothetical protein